MKKIILIVFILIHLVGYSQSKYSKTVQLDSITYKKALLFTNALEWVSSSFKSSNSVIDFKDQESGKIILKCILNAKPISMGMEAEGSTNATITVQVKDGKYKIYFSDIHFDFTNPAGGDFTYDQAIDKSKSGMMKKYYQGYIDKLDSEVSLIIASFDKKATEKESF